MVHSRNTFFNILSVSNIERTPEIPAEVKWPRLVFLPTRTAPQVLSSTWQTINIWLRGRKIITFTGNKLVMDQFHRTLRSEVARQKRFELSGSWLRKSISVVRAGSSWWTLYCSCTGHDMSRAGMLAIIGVLEHRAEQFWTSRRVLFLYDMNSVAGDASENQRINLLSEANAEILDIFMNICKTFNAICQ